MLSSAPVHQPGTLAELIAEFNPRKVEFVPSVVTFVVLLSQAMTSSEVPSLPTAIFFTTALEELEFIDLSLIALKVALLPELLGPTIITTSSLSKLTTVLLLKVTPLIQTLGSN